MSSVTSAIKPSMSRLAQASEKRCHACRFSAVESFGSDQLIEYALRISLQVARAAAASSARRDFDERIVEAAATTPVGRFFPRERVDRCERATRVRDAAKRHPGHARSHAVRHAAHGAYFARAVPDPYGLSRTDGARARIVLVQFDEEFTSALTKRVQVPVPRIEKVQGLAGNELEARRDGYISLGRQGIQAAFEQRLRVELGLAAGGRKCPFGKWAPVRRR